MEVTFGAIIALLFLLFLLFVVFLVWLPSRSRSQLESARKAVIQSIEKKRGSRVIVMIHRQESMSFFGVPISRYIDIEDSEAVLRAIRMTKPDVPLDIILHTPGGLVLAAEQIAHALVRREAPVTVMVPHYAMSGGTLLALASDEILMDPNAVLGPVDPQLGSYPAAGIVDLVNQKSVNSVSDEMFIMAGMAEKSLRQVRHAVIRLQLANGVAQEQAEYIADLLATGIVTHDYPIIYAEAKELGLPVTDELPEEVYKLMDLYPQPSSRKPSVQYISTPYSGKEDQSTTDKGYVQLNISLRRVRSIVDTQLERPIRNPAYGYFVRQDPEYLELW